MHVRENVNDCGRGVTNQIKAFQGQPKFSGLYDDELENISEIYASIADSCHTTQSEKLKAMFVLFKGRAVSFCTRKGGNVNPSRKAFAS